MIYPDSIFLNQDNLFLHWYQMINKIFIVLLENL